MKIVQKKLDDGKVLVSALASTEEVGRALNTAHLAFAQQMGLAPERGKTVAQVAEERMGVRDLDSMVASQAAETLMPFAVDKTGIVPAYPPTVEPKSSLKRGKTFQFEVTITPKPDYELTSYDPVTIPAMAAETSEAEIDEQIEGMANSYAQYLADDPHPVRKGDIVKIAMEAQRADGGKIDALSTTGRTYVTDEGYMPDGFDQNIVGMDVGETKTFSFEAPDIDEQGNQITATLTATVTIVEIQKRVLPTIDDEWVKKFMPFYKDLESLRASIRENLDGAHVRERQNAMRQAAAAEAASRFQGSIADEVYEATSRAMLANLRNSLAQQGTNFKEFVEQQGGEQQFNMMMLLQTREMLVQGYALDAVFRHEGLAITDEDLDEACTEMGGGDPKTMRRQLEESGRGFALREAAERLRANKWLVEHAIVSEAKAQGSN